MATVEMGGKRPYVGIDSPWSTGRYMVAGEDIKPDSIVSYALSQVYMTNDASEVASYLSGEWPVEGSVGVAVNAALRGHRVFVLTHGFAHVRQLERKSCNTGKS